MDLHDAITLRRTVREFRPDPVPAHVVRRALAAGQRAPCNAHLKSWQFILLRDREKRFTAISDKLRARDMKEPGEIKRFIARFADENLKRVYRRSLPVQMTMMLEAPEVLVVCYRTKPLSECHTLFELNALASVWMCIENVMLALAADGVCGCTYTPSRCRTLEVVSRRSVWIRGCRRHSVRLSSRRTPRRARGGRRRADTCGQLVGIRVLPSGRTPHIRQQPCASTLTTTTSAGASPSS